MEFTQDEGERASAGLGSRRGHAAAALGLDFGTESCRAILVDIDSGEELATAVAAYESGVMDRTLPSGVSLPREWALQDPDDYLRSMSNSVNEAMAKACVDPQDIVGVGVAFTACTALPARADGMPLCKIPQMRDRPHAWVKLWKHHGAQPEADIVNELAVKRNERFLDYYGRRISSEWLIPKLLQVYLEDREVYDRVERFIEAGDWVVMQLTGVESRNTCAAGYKGLWNDALGYPTAEFLNACAPGFGDTALDKITGALVAPGVRAGTLIPSAAKLLGLCEGIPVSAAIIDAHAGVVGSGVFGPGTMAMIMGTSACQMVMAETPSIFSGYAGLVRDGIVPGFYGYEYGQSAVGDVFAWFVRSWVPFEYYQEAQREDISILGLMERKASMAPPGGESGEIVALDWLNGNRSVLMDSSLRGVISGIALSTKPEEIYRALVEATAFGAKKILQTHEAGAGPVEGIVACGGLSRNALIMQIYADVMGRRIAVAGSSQPVALGSSMFVALSGLSTQPHDIATTAAPMIPPYHAEYRPDSTNADTYSQLYDAYCELHDYFGLRR